MGKKTVSLGPKIGFFCPRYVKHCFRPAARYNKSLFYRTKKVKLHFMHISGKKVIDRTGKLKSVAFFFALKVYLYTFH